MGFHLRGGMTPYNITGNPLETRNKVPVSATAAALFVGSSIAVVAGEVTEATTSAITGAIVTLYNAAGKAVGSKPASATGFTAEITYKPDQLYVATVLGTGSTGTTAYAAANVGQFFKWSAEASTANSDPLKGDFASTSQAYDFSGTATNRVMRSGSLVPAVNNVYGADGVAIFATINPTYYVPA